MSEPNAFAFIYENLITLTEYGEGTRLCTFEPKKTLYVVKRLPLSAAPVLQKLSGLSSPHLARIFYVAENPEEGFAEAVCEYVGGDALTEYLRRAGGKLPETRAVSVVRDVLEGLSLLHGVGIVHRDVNPNNIVMTPSGNAMIIDYGIVRSFETEKSADTVILGTPGYAAPEQFGFTQSDRRTDLYAVGVLFNLLLTGSLPNVRLTGGRYRPVVKKCIAIDPENRYPSAEAMLKDVKSIENPAEGTSFGPSFGPEEKTAETPLNTRVNTRVNTQEKAEDEPAFSPAEESASDADPEEEENRYEPKKEEEKRSFLAGLPGLGSKSQDIRLFSAVLYSLFVIAVIAACCRLAVIGVGLFILPFLIFCVALPFLTFFDPWQFWEWFEPTAYAPKSAINLFRFAFGTLSLIVGVVLFGVIAG